MIGNRTLCCVAALLASCATAPDRAVVAAGSRLPDATAQEDPGPNDAAIAEESGTEPKSYVVPIEIEYDGGAANGSATVIRAIPLYRLPAGSTWEVVNLDLVTLASATGGVTGRPGDPNPVAGDRAFGLGDITHVSVLERAEKSALIVGVGFGLGLPTATDDVLGSGKWSAGPALRLTYRTGPWNVGAIALQRWSFAGDSERAETNQFMTRGAIRRQLPDDWYLVSAPIITANWDADSQDRWLLPLGGGVGRRFKVGKHRWATSLQVYYNVARPDGAPEWSVRLSIIPAIPILR